MLLTRDMTGSQVYKLNTRLIYLGFHISEDLNKFNWQTDAHIRQFQELNGLLKDGIVGPKTLAALETTKFCWTNTVPRFLHRCKYLSQRDNALFPSGTCNTTSLATVMRFYKEYDDTQLEDTLTKDLESEEATAYFKKTYPYFAKQGYNPRNIHGMLGWLARKHGFKWEFSDDFSTSQMDLFGEQHGPMIISGSFTASGHIVTLIGRTAIGDFIVHDPWGDWNTNYKTKDGSYRIYNHSDMAQILAGVDKTHKRVHRITR